jgi:hypothetical protein
MRAAFVPLILAAQVAGPALAQTGPAAKPETPEIAEQNRRSEALNAEVHGKLRAVDARNAATKAAYDKAMADYRAAVAQHDASAAKVQADYDTSMEAWKAAVAACKAGDTAKCGQPAPTSAAKPAADRAAAP